MNARYDNVIMSLGKFQQRRSMVTSCRIIIRRGIVSTYGHIWIRVEKRSHFISEVNLYRTYFLLKAPLRRRRRWFASIAKDFDRWRSFFSSSQKAEFDRCLRIISDWILYSIGIVHSSNHFPKWMHDFLKSLFSLSRSCCLRSWIKVDCVVFWTSGNVTGQFCEDKQFQACQWRCITNVPRNMQR